MDPTTALNALTKLIEHYPDMDTDTVKDVQHACDHDPVKAYDMLCQLVMPSVPSSTTATLEHTSGGNGDHDHRTATVNVHEYDDDDNDNDYHHRVANSNRGHSSAAAADDDDTDSETDIDASDIATQQQHQHTTATGPPVLQGAWARESMGRKYRVDELCARYAWVERRVMTSLMEKYHDCVELVEGDILQMYPIDEPGQYATPGQLLQHQLQQHHANDTNSNNNNNDWTYLKPTTPTTITAVSPNNNNAATTFSGPGGVGGDEIVYQCDASIVALRNDVWKHRQRSHDLNILAAQTRKPAITAQAKRETLQMAALSDRLVHALEHTVEYQRGLPLDLHGLTRDEAIALVDRRIDKTMLQHSSSSSSTTTHVAHTRRFTFITGKGHHSINGMPVLRPALERHLEKRRVPFTSSAEDGVVSMSVNPTVQYPYDAVQANRTRCDDRDGTGTGFGARITAVGTVTAAAAKAAAAGVASTAGASASVAGPGLQQCHTRMRRHPG